MRAVLTPDDLKAARREPINPGWHPAEIENYDEVEVKDRDDRPSDGSMNAVFFFTILDGPGKDRKLRLYINEKHLAMGESFYAAMGFPKNSAGGYDVDSALFRQTVGHKVMIYVKRNQKSGYDQIEDFKPMT